MELGGVREVAAGARVYVLKEQLRPKDLRNDIEELQSRLKLDLGKESSAYW